MPCMYMVWDKEAEGHELHGLTNAIKGRLVPCGAESVTQGLCAEHAAFVADAKATEVSKVDQKYWFRMPAKRKPKADPSRVVETILPPDEVGSKLRRAYENANGSRKTVAWKALDDYQKQKAKEIHSREWTAEDQAEKDRAETAAHAKAVAEQVEVAKRRADVGKGIKYVGERPDTRPIGKRTAEPMGEVEIFGRFLVLKPVVTGSSAVAYFDVETGIKLAITLEGIKRMGPEVVKKIVSRA